MGKNKESPNKALTTIIYIKEKTKKIKKATHKEV